MKNIPKKYIYQQGKNKGKFIQNKIFASGDFKRGDQHPFIKELFFWSLRCDGIRQIWMIKELFDKKLLKSKNKAKKWRIKNTENRLSYMKEYREKHKERILKQQRKYKIKNKEKCDERRKEWSCKNRLIKNAKNRIYMQSYTKTDKAIELRKERIKRYEQNISFKLKKNLSGRVRMALIQGQIRKETSTSKLLGCNIDNLKKHLESKFQDGMTWDNMGRGGWHIDHIIPCSFFDLSKLTHQKICFNWENLQPLWEKDNCSKGNKLHWSILFTILINNYRTTTKNKSWTKITI